MEVFYGGPKESQGERKIVFFIERCVTKFLKYFYELQQKNQIRKGTVSPDGELYLGLRKFYHYFLQDY
jgi:hypothetical protein